jgi:hypothetical protein
MSSKLIRNLSTFTAAGNRLNDFSKHSEKVLECAIQKNVIPHANKLLEPLGGHIRFEKTISLYECQKMFKNGPVPNENNKTVYMKPDGGILFAQFKEYSVPILITEDKCQGTNDNLFSKDHPRQATGNAIERGAKNIRGAEMIFNQYKFFPYVLFASGCDFHHTETISKRIEMMNMGVPNHYIEVKSEHQNVDTFIDSLLDSVSIKKIASIGIASIFVKAHKWDELPHGSSAWTVPEVSKICCKVIDLVVSEL